jgi:hypothetical protein
VYGRATFLLQYFRLYMVFLIDSGENNLSFGIQIPHASATRCANHLLMSVFSKNALILP